MGNYVNYDIDNVVRSWTVSVFIDILYELKRGK